MTAIRHLLQRAHERLQPLPTARLDAQVLLCHCLGVDKAYLVAHDEQIPSDAQLACYEQLIARRATGEPVAYLVGYQHFWDITLTVTPDVLIPRPETEHLVEAALTYLKAQPQATVVDVGTGSGAIAVTLATHSTAAIHAVDISPQALRIARQNAEKYGVAVAFHQGSLGTPLIERGIAVDLLIANLPYIARPDLPHLAVSQHEPQLALDGGIDGLDLVRQLLCQVPQLCQPHACILLEIGMTQAAAVMDFAQAQLQPQAIHIQRDLAGLERVVQITL